MSRSGQWLVSNCFLSPLPLLLLLLLVLVVVVGGMDGWMETACLSLVAYTLLPLYDEI